MEAESGMGRSLVLFSWLRFYELIVDLKTLLWSYIPVFLALLVITHPSFPLLWILSCLPTAWMEKSLIISTVLRSAFSHMDCPCLPASVGRRPGPLFFAPPLNPLKCCRFHSQNSNFGKSSAVPSNIFAFLFSTPRTLFPLLCSSNSLPGRSLSREGA